VPDPARVVAVTGAAGRLGRVVLDRLVRAPEVERVLAIDVREPLAAHPKIEPIVADVRDSSMLEHLRGCDALVHLAFVVERGSRDEALVDSINIGGTQNVVRAALDVGVDRIVHASSIAAYGFHADNLAGPLTEEAPTRGNDDFYYARTKAACEVWLRELAKRVPNAAISMLRPSVFLGPRGFGRPRIFRSPVMPYLGGGGAAPIHVTHEDDVAEAFYLALAKRAQGAFNVATDEPLALRDWAGAIGRRGVAVPGAALQLMELAYRARVLDVSPAWLRTGRHPIVVSSAKIRRLLRWRPRYPTTGAVLRALAARPTAAASRGTRIFLGTLAAITRVRGGLPTDERQRQELRAFGGSANLLLAGARPSEWHIRFTDGVVGVYGGIDPTARSATTIDEAVLFDMLAGDLSYAQANMTGKIRHVGEGNMSMFIGGLVGGFRQAAHAEGRGGAPLRAWGRWVMRNGPRGDGERRKGNAS
jgi:nucleoside-diphosphate-sugar epimerase